MARCSPSGRSQPTSADLRLRDSRQTSYNWRSTPCLRSSTMNLPDFAVASARRPPAAQPGPRPWSTRSATGSATAGSARAPSCHRIGADGRVRRQPHRHPRGAVQAAGRRPGADAARRRHLRHPWRRRLGGVPDPRRPARDPARRGRHARAADRRRDRGRGPGGAAPQRRQPGGDAAMRSIAFTQAVEAGSDAVGPDFQFHLEIMRATSERPFLEPAAKPRHDHRFRAPGSIRRPPPPTSARAICAGSTPSTARSSTRSRTATAKRRGRRCARTWPTAASGAAAPPSSPRAELEASCTTTSRPLPETPRHATTRRRPARGPGPRPCPGGRAGPGLAGQDDPDRRPLHAGRLVGHHRPRDRDAARRGAEDRP